MSIRSPVLITRSMLKIHVLCANKKEKQIKKDPLRHQINNVSDYKINSKYSEQHNNDEYK